MMELNEKNLKALVVSSFKQLVLIRNEFVERLDEWEDESLDPGDFYNQIETHIANLDALVHVVSQTGDFEDESFKACGEAAGKLANEFKESHKHLVTMSYYDGDNNVINRQIPLDDVEA